MKTKFTITAVLIFMMFFSYAQDTIYKTNGSKIIAKVTEINAVSVKYKFVNNGGELVAEAAKSEIAYIVYAGGLKEIYNPISSSTPIAAKEPLYVSPDRAAGKKSLSELKNIIAINCFDMFFTNFSMSYERSISDGKFSLKVPVTLGLGGKPNRSTYSSSFGDSHFLENKLYSAGLEFNVYPFGITRSTFYIGLSGAYGAFNYYTPNYSYSSPYYPYQYISSYNKFEGTHISGAIHLGGYLGLTQNVLIGGKLGVGYKKEETIYEDFTLPKVQLDLNLAYRF